MLYRWWAAITVSGVLLVSACSAPSQELAGPQTAAEIPQGAKAVSYQVVEEVTTPISGILDRTRLVIGDETAWNEFWDQFADLVQPLPDPPPVDFTTHLVIAATMGQRTSGGYTISVEEVAEKDGTIYAAVQETSPGAMCMNITVMTAPAVAVTVPRHDGPVAFVETELALPCTP